MNSIQLISKLKSKSEDLQTAVQQLNGAINALQKELIKKNCVELYELVLKLQTNEDGSEQKTMTSAIEVPVSVAPIQSIQEETPSQTFKTPEPVLPKADNEPVIAIQTSIVLPETTAPVTTIDIEESSPIQHSFNEFIKQINIEKATLNDLEKTAETAIEVAVEQNSIPTDTTTVETPINQVATTPFQMSNTVITPPEFNIDKAVENKRIQKTVMPDPEPTKKITFNESIAPADPNFNDRLAEKVSNQVSPIIEKSIDAPIENMKTEIGLNKKIAFVNQLFGENVVEYAKAIDRLNQALNIEEGMKLFHELATQFNWDTETNALVIELKQLLHRRHQA